MPSMASRRMGVKKTACGASFETPLRGSSGDERNCARAGMTDVSAARLSIRIEFARPAAKAGCIDVERAGAFVFALAFRKRCAAIAADPRRPRERPNGGVAILLIAREI